MKNTYKNKPVRLYNWNQKIKHIEAFRIIYSYLSILEKSESQGTSPVQTSKHTTV